MTSDSAIFIDYVGLDRRFEGQMQLSTWSGNKIVVIGAARQGLALTSYLVKQGAEVVLNDYQPESNFTQIRADLEAALQDAPGKLTFVFGGHPFEILDDASLLCLSGGVPLNLPIVQEALRRGIDLSNDSQIFIENAPCLVVGVTGSAGKTTTTALLGRIGEFALQDYPSEFSYQKVWVGGNIGNPLISSLNEMNTRDLAIVELSSFQLELMTKSPQVAAILNITPNHLDRHKTMEAYTRAKARILEFQTSNDTAILGRDDPGAWSLKDVVRGSLVSFGFTPLPDIGCGTYLYEDAIYWQDSQSGNQISEKLVNISQIKLRGDHNLLNVMAACAVAGVLNIPADAIRKAVATFTGVPHRLEFIRHWRGADWYNDSIATAPERAIAAIRAFNQPLVLLAGGRDKDLPWEEFARVVKERVDHLILFGEAVEKIHRSLSITGSERFTLSLCKSLKDAVEKAAELVEPGDVVLLSPGGTSFDEFKDFEERGRCFVQWVKELP